MDARNVVRVFSGLLVLCLLALVFPFSVAAQTAAAITASATASVLPGEDLTVRINIANASNTNAYQFQLTYNPDVLQIVGPEGGAGVTPGVVGTTAVGMDMWRFYPGGVPGSVRVLGHLSGAQTFSGSGFLAEIHFHVVGQAGQASALSFVSNLPGFTNNLFDGLSNAQGGSWIGTSVTVRNVSVPQPTIITTPPLPSGEIGKGYAASLLATGGTPPYSWSIQSGSLPPGLVLNPTGTIAGTPTASGGPYQATYQVTDSLGGTGTKLLYVTIVPAPTIATSALPSGEVGKYYAFTLTRSGGVTPFRWSIQGGVLPPGMFFNGSAGSITGVPLVAMSSTITFGLTDGVGAQDTKALQLIVAGSGGTPPPPPTSTTPTPTPTPLLPSITTASLAGGKVGVAYLQSLTGANGTPPYKWSIESGSLPGGLSLDSNAGVISGTPTSAGGPFAITFKLTDSSSKTATKTLNITINLASPSGALTIATASPLPAGAMGRPYSQTLTAEGGKGPYSWSITAGRLPSGLLFSPEGVISGSPIAGGAYDVTFTVTDSQGAAQTKVLSITVVFTPAIVTSFLTNGAVGQTYSQTLAVRGGLSPYTWSIRDGALPAGLNLGTVSGIISGTPLVSGVFTFTLAVTDRNSFVATRSMSITIKGP